MVRKTAVFITRKTAAAAGLALELLAQGRRPEEILAELHAKNLRPSKGGDWTWSKVQLALRAAGTPYRSLVKAPGKEIVTELHAMNLRPTPKASAAQGKLDLIELVILKCDTTPERKLHMIREVVA